MSHCTRGLRIPYHPAGPRVGGAVGIARSVKLVIKHADLSFLSELSEQKGKLGIVAHCSPAPERHRQEDPRVSLADLCSPVGQPEIPGRDPVSKNR